VPAAEGAEAFFHGRQMDLGFGANLLTFVPLAFEVADIVVGLANAQQ